MTDGTKHSRWVRWIFAVAGLLIVTAIIIFLTPIREKMFNDSNNDSDETGSQILYGEQSKAIMQASDDDEDLTRILNEQGPIYAEVMPQFAEVNASAYAQWDQTVIDRAYFALVFADKTGAFGQVYTILSHLEQARYAGIDIDNNGLGIDQAARESFRQRADERSVAAFGEELNGGSE
ncbi:hypothetical protein FWD20_03930 [Candidatus Saccharibacteria bacterium]|nr:hypothetical protein [Candidatus Saccharibacteria bacterium]